MRFLNLQYIYYIALLPVLLVFYIWSNKLRRRDLTFLANTSLLDRLLANYRPNEHKLRISLMLTGILFVLIALLGPQWGFDWETVTHRGVDIIIAVDTSKSMLAEDVKPNRLERSKLIIQDLVGQLQGDRVGLVSFAGTSFLQVPLTVDYNALMQGVQSLNPGIMPQGGTAIGQAMENAMDAFENVSAENKLLILFTDGENHLGDPVSIAAKARDAGIQVIVIAMGTTSGELIPVVENGRRQFVKDESGNVVKSKLDEALLKEIASTGKGAYISGTDLVTLEKIYDQYIGKLKMNEYTTTRKKNYHQRYQIFLLIGLLLICAEMLIGIKREVRS